MRMMMLTIVGAASLTGCVTTELSSDGQAVRQINAERADDCDLLGIKEIEFDYVNKDATGVISRDYYVRNVVAQAGADAFRVTDETSRTDSTRKVELYNCSSALDKLATAMARLESRSAANSLAE
jgi:hypothetical protein